MQLHIIMIVFEKKVLKKKKQDQNRKVMKMNHDS